MAKISDEQFKRMNEELSDLSIKRDKLNSFIDENEKFNELSNIQRILLVNQFNAMELYIYALASRIEYIND
jgi:hypothetical protein